MRYSFLCDADLEAAIKSELRDQLTGGNNTLIITKEAAAVSLAKSYLNERFDTEAIFNSITNYIPATAYLAGAQVFYQENFYVALVDTSQAPNTEDWLLADRRDPWLVSVISNITLYELHPRLAGRNIPQPRIDAYIDAMDWLKAVAGLGKGAQITPQLPRRQDPDLSVDTILYGSQPQRGHYY